MKNIFNIENRFFYRISTLVDYLFLNIVFLITTLPIVTVFICIVAINKTMNKRKSGDQNHPIKLYLSYLREEWQQLVKWTLLLFPLLLLVITNIVFTFSVAGVPNSMKVITIISFNFGFVFISGLLMYLSKYRSNVLESCKLTLLLIVTNVRLVVFGIFELIVILYIISPYGIIFGTYFILFGGFMCLSFIRSIIYLKVFEKYESKG